MMQENSIFAKIKAHIFVQLYSLLCAAMGDKYSRTPLENKTTS